MSDRVAIIGGHTSGRDHFPWSTNGSIPTDGFISLSLAQMSRWFWLVRRWHLSLFTTIQGLKNNPDYPDTDPDHQYLWAPYTISVEFDYEFPVVFNDIGRQAVREADLVADFRGTAFNGFHVDEAGGFVFDGSQTVPSWDIIILSASSSLNNSGGSFTLANAFAWAHGCTGGFSSGNFYPEVVAVGVACGTGSFASVSFIGTFSIDGYAIPIYGDVFPAWPIDHFNSALATNMNITVTPVLFWPYAARDGSPIYNTSNGSQLQSPFN